MQKKYKTAKKLTASFIIIVMLSICLAVTTFALILSMVSVEDNIFRTGTVKINLNDGNPIIKENELIFEPGMTVKKDFYVKNESSDDIYYKLYFQNVSGVLSEIINIKICCKNKVLFEGTPKNLKQENVGAADDILKPEEIRELQIYFHFPKDSGNNTQNRLLTFDMAADAVQTKNNINKEFN